MKRYIIWSISVVGIIGAAIVLIGVVGAKKESGESANIESTAETQSSVSPKKTKSKSADKNLREALRKEMIRNRLRSSANSGNLSFEELKKEAELMSDVEIENEISRLQGIMKSENFVERANSNSLTQQEENELKLLMRQTNALTVVRAMRKLDDDALRYGDAGPIEN